jgi:hypothetical protein
VVQCFAADIRYELVSADVAHDIRPDWSGSLLDIRYTGDVKIGDSDQLRAILDGHKYDYARLHLHSDGGEFRESLKVAAIVYQYGITTSIDEDKECYSACAVIFMAGRELGYEGPASTSRYLNISGQLGFHAPFLLLDCQAASTCAPDREVYRDAMLDISNLLLGSTSLKWPPSLVGEMLRTPPEDALSIKTVDQAGRWYIDLFGYAVDSKPTTKRLTISCLNAFRWADENKYDEYPLSILSDDYYSGWAEKVTSKKIVIQELQTDPPTPGIQYDVPIDNLSGLRCTVQVTGQTVALSTEGDISGLSDWPSWKARDPTTLITDLGH